MHGDDHGTDSGNSEIADPSEDDSIWGTFSRLEEFVYDIDEQLFRRSDDGTRSGAAPDELPENTTSNEGNQSMFADLLARIQDDNPKQNSGEADQRRLNLSDNLAEDEFVDPLDRVRELIPEGLEPPRINQEKSGGKSGTMNRKKLYAALILGIVIAFAVPGIVFAMESTLNEDFFSSNPSTYFGTDDTLYLGANDADYMSRVFGESRHEVAFCGVISRVEGRPMLDVSLANTIESGPESVSFNTENCPDTNRQVLLHTHPSGDTRLSQQDRHTIATRPESIICVLAGPITAPAGQETENLACYKQLSSANGDPQLDRIRVIIA